VRWKILLQQFRQTPDKRLHRTENGAVELHRDELRGCAHAALLLLVHAEQGEQSGSAAVVVGGEGTKQNTNINLLVRKQYKQQSKYCLQFTRNSVLNNTKYKHQPFSLKTVQTTVKYTVYIHIHKKFRHTIHHYLNSGNLLHHK
jgi:hypothetical protein